MSEKPVYLTRDGKAKLEEELADLVNTGRRQAAERIAAAKELGDISESGEYEEAKNFQAMIEGRIREINMLLSRAVIIEDEMGDSVKNEVHIGCQVTVRFDDSEEEETWMIVGSTEASPRAGRISNESPIGAALIGKRPRQKVSVQTPSGLMKLTVVRVR